MALDRNKALQAAEKLFKQGKSEAALEKLGQVGHAASGDPITLNRIGDLLAKQRHPAEAIEYYRKIATQFTSQGYYPKAIAIVKKILRLEPEDGRALVQLGELYLRQKLPGEARTHLVRAAEGFLAHDDLTRARETYEKLVEAEPDRAEHRFKLAEARAAEGHSEAAGEELLGVGRRLLDSGELEGAGAAFKRAGELLGDRPEPLIGTADAMAQAGQTAEAVQLLEERHASQPHPIVRGELAVRYVLDERHGDAYSLIEGEGAWDIPAETWQRLFRAHLDRGEADKLWGRLDPHLTDWREQGRVGPLVELLEAVGDLEPEGHVPALRRLVDVRRATGDPTGAGASLERLVGAYRKRSMQDEASMALEELREVAPKSPLLEGAKRQEPRSSERVAPPPRPEAPVPQASAAGTTPLQEAEAPAVPLSRSDEEFVSGRLTQAEILEKYGLRDQALEQAREVTARFPGHELGQERLVALARGLGQTETLAGALLGLALARRASGNVAGAKQTAEEALGIGLDGEQEALLVQLGLKPSAPPPTPVPPTVTTAAQEPATGSEDVVIDFDEVEVDGGPAREKMSSQAPAATGSSRERPGGNSPQAVGSVQGRRPVRAPGPDMLEEIDDALTAGRVDQARQRIDTLRALGYASEELDNLEQRAAVSDAGSAPPPAAASPASGPTVRDAEIAAADDDDLGAITAALESEFLDEDAAPTAADPESEQSIEEVFAAFKEHVEQEVGREDARTHYELGIGYKEMGLYHEAMSEFEVALDAPELKREAAVMMAMCHREQGDMEQAATWYRQAIEAPGGDTESLSNLRYELAETLLQGGHKERALDTFRTVLKTDPSYRDVRHRIAELESQPSS